MVGQPNRNGDFFGPSVVEQMSAQFYRQQMQKESFKKLMQYGLIDYDLGLPDEMLAADQEHQMIADVMLGLQRVTTGLEVSTPEGRITIGFEMLAAMGP